MKETWVLISPLNRDVTYIVHPDVYSLDKDKTKTYKRVLKHVKGSAEVTVIALHEAIVEACTKIATA